MIERLAYAYAYAYIDVGNRVPTVDVVGLAVGKPWDEGNWWLKIKQRCIFRFLANCVVLGLPGLVSKTTGGYVALGFGKEAQGPMSTVDVGDDSEKALLKVHVSSFLWTLGERIVRAYFPRRFLGLDGNFVRSRISGHRQVWGSNP